MVVVKVRGNFLLCSNTPYTKKKDVKKKHTNNTPKPLGPAQAAPNVAGLKKKEK